MPQKATRETVPITTSVVYTDKRPFRRYLAWYAIASMAITAVWGSALGILLPNQVQRLEFAQWFTGADSDVDLTALSDLKNAVANGTAVATAEQQRLLALLSDFDASRAQALSLVVALGVLGTMFAQPLAGVLSDRTRSRLGRRAPWLLFGGIVGALFLIALPYAPSIAILALLWAVAQTVLNFALGPLYATVPDRVPSDRLGVASALGGLGTFLGGLAGGIAAGVAFAAFGLHLYFAVAALVLFGVIGFVIAVPDRSSTGMAVPRQHWKSFLAGLVAPLRDADFRWVWAGRVSLSFGYAISTAFSLYMLQSYVTPALSATDATKLVPLITFAAMPGTLVALAVAGRLSDRLGRRKPFVVAAALLMAASMAVPLLWPVVPALFLQSVLAGIAFGIYLPVDQALFIDVLPDKDSAGRDLGIAAMASNLGQALGPVIAGQVIALFDPADPVSRSVSWLWLHRPAGIYVGGEPADAPRYKVVPSVPEGQLDEQKRASVIAEVTEAILDAENGTWPRDASRIWVFPTEIPEGHWGGWGQIRPLATILARLSGGDTKRARTLARERIAASRAEHARLP